MLKYLNIAIGNRLLVIIMQRKINKVDHAICFHIERQPKYLYNILMSVTQLYIHFFILHQI